MKKFLFILIAFVTLAATSQAQMLSTTMTPNQTWVNVATNYTLTDAVAQYWFISAPKDYYTAQAVVVELDSLTGNHTNVAVQLQGRYSSSSATWNNIGSAVNWKGTTADTTIVILNATENGYREFKLLFTGTGTGTTRIDNMQFKMWYGLP
jgi:hypothetical protein